MFDFYDYITFYMVLFCGSLPTTSWYASHCSSSSLYFTYNYICLIYQKIFVFLFITWLQICSYLYQNWRYNYLWCPLQNIHKHHRSRRDSFIFFSSFFFTFKHCWTLFIIWSYICLIDSDYASNVYTYLCNLALFSIALVFVYLFCPWDCNWALNLLSISRRAFILFVCYCFIKFRYCLNCPSTIWFFVYIASSSVICPSFMNLCSIDYSFAYFCFISIICRSS